MTICIIPARSGSKRIKNKNIQKINNQYLISIVIKIAKKSGIFKRIVVSTDSKKSLKLRKISELKFLFLEVKNYLMIILLLIKF